MQKWQKELMGMTEYVKHCSVSVDRKMNVKTGKSVAPTSGGFVTFGPTGAEFMEPRRYTIAAVVDHENGFIAIATAVAHPIDVNKFSKKIGKSIALGRARKIMAVRHNMARGTAYQSFHGLFDLNTTPAYVIKGLINESAVGAEAWFGFILKRHAEINTEV